MKIVPLYKRRQKQSLSGSGLKQVWQAPELLLLQSCCSSQPAAAGPQHQLQVVQCLSAQQQQRATDAVR
jgi:hypothetical protein